MIRNVYYKKFAAVLMMLIVFVAIMKTTSFAHGMNASSGTNISQALYQADSVDSGTTPMGDCKPPKQSFVDYDFFFSCTSFRPLNPLHDSLLAPPLDTQAVSGAWPDIFIPPKI